MLEYMLVEWSEYWGIVRFPDMEFICGYKRGMFGGALKVCRIRQTLWVPPSEPQNGFSLKHFSPRVLVNRFGGGPTRLVSGGLWLVGLDREAE